MDEQRLRRVFDVIGHLAGVGDATISEISRDLDLPVSSAHDLLRALTAVDAVVLFEKRYRLGPRSVRLALDTLDSMGVPRVAQPHLERLAQSCGIDTYLAMRTGTKVLYVSRYAGSQPVNIDIPLGRPLYLHATAVGKLFAALDRDMYAALASARRPALTNRTRTTLEQLARDFRTVRRRQISISRSESVVGVLGIATPVRAADSRLVGAVHLSMLQGTVDAARVRNVEQELQQTSQAIEADLHSHLGQAPWAQRGSA